MQNAVREKAVRSLLRQEKISRILFAVLTLFSLTVTTICLINALKWINKRFPGFLINERVVVAPVGQYHWTGTQAGLKYPDKIVSANGKPVHTAKELEEVIQSSKNGDSVTYVVERGSKSYTAEVLPMRFSWYDLLMTFGTSFLPGLTYILIGVVVFFMKPDKKVSWIFFIACLFLGLWTITIFDMQSTHFGFIRLYLLAAVLFPATFVHFSFFFPEPQKFITRYPQLQILPYLIAFGIGTPMELIYPQKGFQIFYSLSLGYMLIAAIAVLFPVMATYFRPVSVLAKQRSKVVLFGAAIAFPIPTVAYASQLLFGSFMGVRMQTNLLIPALIFFSASIAYAIARHNLFDVDVYIKRAVGYAFMTAIIVGGYLGVSIPLNVLVGKYQIAQSRAFPILFTLVVILIFNPLYSRVQAFVDRVFFRKEYDYGKIIDTISGAMTSLLDLGQILKRLVRTFMEDMFIDTSSVVLLTSAGTQYQVTLADGERKQDVEKVVINREEPVMEIIEKRKKELTKYDVLEDPKYRAVSESCAASFEALHASLMVPLIYQDEVIGILSLGEKKSGKFYSRQDIDLLHAIANQGAVAIENARMVEEVIEKERMEEELSIARDLQVSMLPATCPQIEGFAIAAYSISAREVGGDFYDFIEMGKEKVGIVIGDVTGKSVSGALVMSASRSVFRMLSEEELSVGESMIRANRRIKKDIKTGMFVALLYAVINGQRKSLSLCSAGQTQPIHLSAKTGDVRFIETTGDTFPLGILDEVYYKESQIQLEAGDKVVFYTDGIVEAMNKNEEIYGFERLLEVIKVSRSETAEALLKEILESVRAFTVKADQHDDLTAIVVSAAG